MAGLDDHKVVIHVLIEGGSAISESRLKDISAVDGALSDIDGIIEDGGPFGSSFGMGDDTSALISRTLSEELDEQARSAVLAGLFNCSAKIREIALELLWSSACKDDFPAWRKYGSSSAASNVVYAFRRLDGRYGQNLDWEPFEVSSTSSSALVRCLTPSWFVIKDEWLSDVDFDQLERALFAAKQQGGDGRGQSQDGGVELAIVRLFHRATFA